MAIHIQHFFEEITGTLSYVVHNGETGVIIDPVLDYDPPSGRTFENAASEIAEYVRTHKLSIPYVIDTHAHADHITAIPYFKKNFGCKSVTGALMGDIQRVFRDIYNLGDDFPVDASQFDILIDEGETLAVGTFKVEAMHTPGHTPAHMSWKIEDALFVGDTLFMPDYGSARCDFPGGSAEQLYDSIQRIYALPDETRLFMCHDYRPDGRPLAFMSTVAEQKAGNIQINAVTTKAEYVAFRKEKDAGLAAPRQILPALQVNIRAGEFPDAEANGVRYLKIPLNVLGQTR